MFELHLTRSRAVLAGVSAALLTQLLVPTGCAAQEAGRWGVSAGGAALFTRATSGNLTAPSLPNTTIDLSDASAFALNLRYAFTDRWAISVPLGSPYTIDFDGAGAIARTGQLASSKLATPTLLIQ